MKKIMVLVLFLVFTSVAFAADLYVSKTGNDSNDGSSWTEAKLTIQAAVDIASSGNTIDVNTGTYDETVTLASGLTLDGIDKTASIARTGSGEKCIVVDDDTTIKNLTLSTTSKTSNTWAIEGTSKSNIRVENCDVLGAYDTVRFSSGCSGVLFENCSLSGYYDIVYPTGTEITLNNCSIYSDGTYATNVNIRGVFCPTVTTVILNNCSIETIGTAGSTKNIYSIFSGGVATSKIVVNNCTITSSTSGSGTACDIYNSAGLMYVVDSSYDRTKTYGTIIEASRTRRRYDCEFSYRR